MALTWAPWHMGHMALSEQMSEEDPPVPGIEDAEPSEGTAPTFGVSQQLTTNPPILQVVQASQRPQASPMRVQRCHLHKRPQQGCKRCAKFKTLTTGQMSTQLVEKVGSSEVVGELWSSGRRQGAEVDEPAVGFNIRFRNQILTSEYYRVIRHTVNSVEGLIEEVQQSAEHAEPHTQHSDTVPSTLFCCIYRLAQLQPSKDQLQQILSCKGSPLVRAVALLHLRFNFPPCEAWTWLRNFLFDTEAIRPSGHSSVTTPIGEWVEKLLTDDKYYDTLLPRLPLSLKRDMALELVQLPQLRQAASKRSRRDLRLLAGAKVHVLHGAKWCSAVVVSSCAVGRSLLVEVELEDGTVEELPFGLVRLQERTGSRSRSRSPVGAHSPNAEAKLRDEYLRRDRDKAVAEDKQYFKPVQKLKRMLTTKDKSLVFRSGPDMPAPNPKVQGKEEPVEREEDVCRETEPAKSLEEERRQQFMQVVQKYQAAGSRDTARLEYHKWNEKGFSVDVLVPDMLRLG